MLSSEIGSEISERRAGKNNLRKEKRK
jgi:hypothetical protein